MNSVHRGGGCSRFCSNFGGSALDFALIFGGGGGSRFCSNFGGGVSFLGGVPPNFGGGLLGGPPNFFGGVCVFLGGVPPNFRGWGGLFFGGPSKFWGGVSPLEYGHHSAGTHPTGMHSCLLSIHE